MEVYNTAQTCLYISLTWFWGVRARAAIHTLDPAVGNAASLLRGDKRELGAFKGALNSAARTRSG